MVEFLESTDIVCWKTRDGVSRSRRNMFLRTWTTTTSERQQRKTECFQLRRYRKSRFQRVAALLPHGEGRAASQTAQLPPHALPLQRVVGHPQGKLQAGEHTHSWILIITTTPRKGSRVATVTNTWAQPLTLSSADSPRSVSFRELHGNWPVTLYRLRVRLEERTTAPRTQSVLNPKRYGNPLLLPTYLRSKNPGWGLKKDSP